MDPRALKLADIVTGHSVYLNDSDLVVIRSEPEFHDFNEVLRVAAEKRGARVRTIELDPHDVRALVARANIPELETYRDRLLANFEGATKAITVDAESFPDFLTGLPDQSVDAYRQLVSGPIVDRVTGSPTNPNPLIWTLVGYPSAANAAQVGMSYAAFADFVFKATTADVAEYATKLREAKKILDYASRVEILVPGKTELSLSLRDRGGLVCDGHLNLPDAELAYGPIEDSVEGFVTFPFANRYDGQTIPNIRLEFARGRVERFSADGNKSFLEKVFANEDNRRVGEFGIGGNYSIEQYLGLLLYDEKIGGTIHLALGQSYTWPLTEGGGLNWGKADVHWDLICDLRKSDKNPGGEFRVDGTLIQKNGSWLI